MPQREAGPPGGSIQPQGGRDVAPEPASETVACPRGALASRPARLLTFQAAGQEPGSHRAEGPQGTVVEVGDGIEVVCDGWPARDATWSAASGATGRHQPSTSALPPPAQPGSSWQAYPSPGPLCMQHSARLSACLCPPPPISLYLFWEIYIAAYSHVATQGGLQE